MRRRELTSIRLPAAFCSGCHQRDFSTDLIISSSWKRSRFGIQGNCVCWPAKTETISGLSPASGLQEKSNGDQAWLNNSTMPEMRGREGCLNTSFLLGFLRGEERRRGGEEMEKRRGQCVNAVAYLTLNGYVIETRRIHRKRKYCC